MSGAKIIRGLEDAVAGNFASVTIEGQRWVRADAPRARQVPMAVLEGQIERLRKNDFAGMETMRTFALGIIDDLLTPSAVSTDASVALQVWYGAMPESNGKSNFTAVLHKGDMVDGHTIARSEYPERVRYEADRVRFLIGELPEMPDVLTYDADAHSGYVEPARSTARGAEPVRWQEAAALWIEDKAELLTNSLHCGDSSMQIHFTHKHAATLKALATEIRALSPTPSNAGRYGLHEDMKAAAREVAEWDTSSDAMTDGPFDLAAFQKEAETWEVVESEAFATPPQASDAEGEDNLRETLLDDAVVTMSDNEPLCISFGHISDFTATLGDLRRYVFATPAQPGDVREALERAKKSFEKIRLTLVNNLEEPERTAFWEAVHAREYVLAALSAPSAAVTDEWRDISTAPKDGTHVLLFFPFIGKPCSINGFTFIAHWNCTGTDTTERWLDPDDFEEVGETATHWMPLPAPPVARNDRQTGEPRS